MHFGLRIDRAILGGDKFKAMYGDLGSYLSRIKEWGIEFVEIGFEEIQSLSEIEGISRECDRKALFNTFHPYLQHELAPEITGGRIDEDWFRRLSGIALANSRGGGTPISVVFHGGRALWEPSRVSYEDTVANTRAFFGRVDELARREFPGIQICCETQIPAPPQQGIRVGDTYTTCIELVQDSRAALCWDFGHTFWAALLEKHPLEPDDGFLSRIRHIHAHDAKRETFGYRDHISFDTGLCPWRRYASLAIKAGFDGNVVFELNPVREGMEETTRTGISVFRGKKDAAV